MSNLVLWSIFSLAVLVHMAIGYRCNEEIKNVGGSYFFAMTKLLRRQELELKITAISFFTYVLLGLVIMLEAFAGQ